VWLAPTRSIKIMWNAFSHQLEMSTAKVGESNQTTKQVFPG
jgi:hypothetical protein